jgi:hypothetical protein
VLVVLSKSDLLEDPNQLKEVSQFVSGNFRTLLGIDPVIFPVSSKFALKAKTDVKGMNNILCGVRAWCDIWRGVWCVVRSSWFVVRG